MQQDQASGYENYAVLSIGSKQQVVRPGELVSVELLEDPIGQSVVFEQVLLVKSKSAVKVGTPFVDGAKVTAKVVREEKGPKIKVMHKRRRKNSKKLTGHRQHYTLLQIDKIQEA